MEKYSRRESILLGLSPQISFGNPASSSPKVVDRNSDIDFTDVFGGPPRRRSSISERRSSISERQYSFNEPADSFTSKQDDEPVVSRNLWAGLSENRVFGEEPAYGRRHPGNGFFDDIFKGEESCASSPKQHDREPFSPKFSRISSPIMPLPPMAETFRSPSPPARLSLPARVVRGIDFTSFGLPARSSNKCNDLATDGVNPSYSPSLSRFSSLSSQAQEDIKHDIQSFYRTSLSSQELNHSRDDPSEGTNTGDSLEKSLNSAEDSTNGSQFQFHFSIYKWANKEVPLTMPPTRMNLSRSKESPKTRKSSSSNGRTTADKNGRESPTSTLRNFDHPPNNHVFMNTNSFKLRHGKEESDLALEERNQQTKEPSKIVGEPSILRPESEKAGSRRGSADPALFHNPAKFNSFTSEGFSEITEKELPQYTTEAFKHESLSYFLSTEDDAKGATEGTYKKDGGAETEAKSNRRLSLTVDNGNVLKKNNGEATVIRKTEVEKSSSQGSPANSGLSDGRQRVGKVKDFVKIFNQEHSSTSVGDPDGQSQSSKQKKKGTSGTGIEVGDSTRIYEKLPQKKLNETVANVKNVVSNVPIDVDELSKQPSTDQPADKPDSDGINTTFSEQNSPTLCAESIPEDSKFTVIDIDLAFQDDFLIKELPQDEIKQSQIQNDREEIKAIDAKIRQWSRGKEGNIRSLLSTLQYVLWPESGWRPVPLVDIIDGNAVKRSYQRALLCLHPDKLQQRGVKSQQKYTAEKVFDILQEAWTLFSSVGPL